MVFGCSEYVMIDVILLQNMLKHAGGLLCYIFRVLQTSVYPWTEVETRSRF